MWKVKIVDIFNSIHNARGVTCQAVLPWKPYKMYLSLFTKYKGASNGDSHVPIMNIAYINSILGILINARGLLAFCEKLSFPFPADMWI